MVISGNFNKLLDTFFRSNLNFWEKFYTSLLLIFLMSFPECGQASTYDYDFPASSYYRQDKQWGRKAIRTREVWEKYTTGNSNAPVVVIDTGIESEHIDLVDNLSKDLSKNFYNGRNGIADEDGHGTMIAGIIAAQGNNGFDIIGLNRHATIISLRTSVNEEEKNKIKGYTDEVFNNYIESLKHIEKLIRNRNKKVNTPLIVNISYGGFSTIAPDNVKNSKGDAVEKLWTIMHKLSETDKVLFIVSAGNYGESLKVESSSRKGKYFYPPSFLDIKNMITVANAQNDLDYTREEGSNYNADIAAPGTDIFSTISTNHSSGYANLFNNKGSFYANASGTSFAAPFVAGAASLIVSKYPTITATALKTAILKGANSYYAKDYTAHGFLNIEGSFRLLAGESVPYGVPVDDFNFPDDIFRKYVSDNFDNDENGYLDDDELAAVKVIDLSNTEIFNLEGIRNFKDLISLDLSGCTQLVELNCSGRKTPADVYSIGNITTLNLQGCTNLKNLDCTFNKISELNLQGCNRLASLHCEHNNMMYLDLNYCKLPDIYYISQQDCYRIEFTETEDSYLIDLNKYISADKFSNIQADSIKCYFSEDDTITVNAFFDRDAGIIYVPINETSKEQKPSAIVYDYNCSNNQEFVMTNIQLHLVEGENVSIFYKYLSEDVVPSIGFPERESDDKISGSADKEKFDTLIVQKTSGLLSAAVYDLNGDGKLEMLTVTGGKVQRSGFDFSYSYALNLYALSDDKKTVEFLDRVEDIPCYVGYPQYGEISVHLQKSEGNIYIICAAKLRILGAFDIVDHERNYNALNIYTVKGKKIANIVQGKFLLTQPFPQTNVSFENAIRGNSGISLFGSNNETAVCKMKISSNTLSNRELPEFSLQDYTNLSKSLNDTKYVRLYSPRVMDIATYAKNERIELATLNKLIHDIEEQGCILTNIQTLKSMGETSFMYATSFGIPFVISIDNRTGNILSIKIVETNLYNQDDFRYEDREVGARRFISTPPRDEVISLYRTIISANTLGFSEANKLKFYDFDIKKNPEILSEDNRGLRRQTVRKETKIADVEVKYEKSMYYVLNTKFDFTISSTLSITFSNLWIQRTRNFFDLLKNGSAQEILDIIESGVNIHARYNGGDTALISALSSNSPKAEVVRLLIDAGADVNETNSNNGKTPLMTALKKNSTTEIVDLLIKSGADIHTPDKEGFTPLMLASLRHSPEVVSLLLNAGAYVNETEKHGATALMVAAAQNTAEVVGLLIKSGADIHARDKDGHTALMYASHNKNHGVKDILIKAGADENAKDNSGKTAEDYRKEIEMQEAENKTEKKSEINNMPEGSTSSDDANKETNAKSKSVRDTKKTEASIVNQENSLKLSQQLLEILEKNADADVATVKKLIDQGANVKFRDVNNATALMYAAKFNHDAKIIKILIDNGADVNAHDNFGVTALMQAARRNNADIVKALLDAGAKETIDNRGWTALFWAVTYTKYPEVIEVLLDAKFSPKMTDKYMLKPINYSIKNKMLSEPAGLKIYERLDKESK